MNKFYVMTIILVAVFTAGGFAGGMKYEQSKVSKSVNRVNQQNRFGGIGNMRPVNGQILSVDDKSFTVKLADGSSKIVLFSPTTTFNKTSAGASTDLKMGDNVAAFGTENSDGSMTSASVQLNPVFRGGRMGQ